MNGMPHNPTGARAPVWFSPARWAFAALLFATLLLAGCGKPVPPEKLSYVGFWQAKDMELTITADGRVEYWRKTKNKSSNISAPIQRWEGDDFFVGVGALSTRFKVSKPPVNVDGVWTMTVDGVELKRSGQGAQWTGLRAEWQPGRNGTSFRPAGSAPGLFL